MDLFALILFKLLAINGSKDDIDNLRVDTIDTGRICSCYCFQ